MSETSVKQLPYGVIKLISSTQVICSVSSVIKELVENSIDAGASVIDIKLEKCGLEKIEVRDNGGGITTSDVHNVCKPNYTSKICSFEDLETLRSYGFRGEALNSICAVSQVSITTRTEQDEIASIYTFDSNGTIRDVQASHQMTGTIVTVKNLFKNVPVRRQFYDNTRKSTEELKKIEKLVKVIAVINPKLRVTLAHNKCLIWHKTSVNTLKQSLMQMYPHVVLKNLEYFSHSGDDFSLEMLICKRDCNWSVLCQPLNEAVLFFINRRPVKDKKVEKMVLEEMIYIFQSALPSNRCPLTLISIKLAPEVLDVNLEPDKTKVFIKNHENVLKQIRECIMLHFYKQPIRETLPETEVANISVEGNASKKPKVDLNYESTDTKEASFDCRASILTSTISENEDTNISNLEVDIRENTEVLRAFNEFRDRDISQFEDISESNDESHHLELTGRFESNDVLDSEAISLRQSELQTESVRIQGQLVKPGVNADFVIFDNMVDNLFESLDAENKEIYSKDCSEISNDYAETNTSESSAPNCHLVADIRVDPPESKRFVETTSNVDTQEKSSFSSGMLQSLQDEFNTDFDIIKRISDAPQNTNTLNSNLTQTTLSQWSKGHVVLNNQPLQNGSVLTTRNRNEDSWVGKRIQEINLKSKEPANILERSVSSQMGRKDLAGLTNFTRSVRQEIIKKNPGISFTKVANELATRWRNLSDFDKNNYAEKAKIEKNKKTSAPVVTKTNPLIKKQTVLVQTSIESIKRKLMKFKEYNKIENVRIIKVFNAHNLCLCRIVHAVALVDVPNLQKNVLFHRYLCYSTLPSRCLDERLRITSKLIGDEYWTFLLTLDRSSDESGTIVIADPRIVKNGFRMTIKEVDKVVEIYVTDVARESEIDGTAMLMETLRLSILYKDLQSCRPDTIKRLLQKKVTETYRERSAINSDEVEILLQYWVQSMSQQKYFSSNEPVSVKLCNLP